MNDFPGVFLAAEDHRDAQRDLTEVLAAGHSCLRPLDMNDVAEVTGAVPGDFLEARRRAIPELGRCVGGHPADSRRPAARRAKRIRESDVVALREELQRASGISFHVLHERLSERLYRAAEVARGCACFLSRERFVHRMNLLWAAEATSAGLRSPYESFKGSFISANAD